MAGILIIILVLLYLFGYIHIPGIYIPNPLLFTFNGQGITLVNLLVFLAILWAIGVLPTPLRQIAMVLVILWLLSIIGIISIFGLSHLLVLAIVIGLIISIL